MTELAGRTYGVIDPAQVASLSGLEQMQGMCEGRLPSPPMARALNFWLAEVSSGMAVFEGEPTADILNPLGTIHGGLLLTLIDSACGCACHTTLPAGVGYASIETKANFSRPLFPDSGRIRCVGRVITAGRTIVTADAVATDARGRVVGHGTSTLLVFQPKAAA